MSSQASCFSSCWLYDKSVLNSHAIYPYFRWSVTNTGTTTKLPNASEVTLNDISKFTSTKSENSLRWPHNGRDSVSNHQPYECLLNRLFRRRWKKTSKLRVTLDEYIERPRQNGHHFPNDILKCIFLNESMWISIKISLKFGPMVQLTTFHRFFFRYWLGAGQVINHYLNQWWSVYWRIYASLGLNELILQHNLKII